MSACVRSVPIGTLGDLVAVTNYNFRAFEKRITKLTRKNRTVTILAVIALGGAVLSELERRKQEEQVYQLSVRVKKLECGEGE